MNINTVTELRSRRKDDGPIDISIITDRAAGSSPAFAVALPLPTIEPLRSPFSIEPFPESVLANARAERLRAANAALARRTEERLQADKLQRRQLAEARDEGYFAGEKEGLTHGWLLGLLVGVIFGGGITTACMQLGLWVGSR